MSADKLFEKLTFVLRSKDDDPLSQRFLETIPKNIVRRTNKLGQNALHIAILSEASLGKINTILGILPELVRAPLNGRIPLHIAFDCDGREDLAELIARLVDAWPPGTNLADQDGRKLLHLILEQKPFPASFTALAMRICQSCPQQAWMTVNGKTPLVLTLENDLPPRLILCVLKQARSLAGVPRPDGMYPLHLAVESVMDIRVLAELIAAYPNALLKRMPSLGGPCAPLEHAVRSKLSSAVVRCLLIAKDSSLAHSATAQMFAYARAAGAGRLAIAPWTELPGDAGRFLDEAEANSSAGVKPSFSQGFKVKSAGGESTYIMMDLGKKVIDLKAHLSPRVGLPAGSLRLMLDQVVLGDDRTLRACGIGPGKEVTVGERFELFHNALRCGVEEDLCFSFLKLRPEAAFEEDQRGMLPLHLALMPQSGSKRHTSIVVELIKLNPKAVNIEMQCHGYSGEYALNVALKGGFPIEVIKPLLQHTNANDWLPDGRYNPQRLGALELQNWGKLPLHAAMESGCCETVEAIIEKNCPVLARDPLTHRSALECALVSAYSERLFTVILDAVAIHDPQVLGTVGTSGQVPLHVAVMNKASVPVVQALCELYMAALDIKDDDGRLPIHLAAAKQASAAVVRVLVTRSPQSVHSFDKWGRTPIQIAVISKATPGVVCEIINVDPTTASVRDQHGASLLDLAVKADAPNSVIQELTEMAPELCANVSMLSKGWPNTKAATFVIQLLQQKRAFQRTRQAQASGFPGYPGGGPGHPGGGLSASRDTGPLSPQRASPVRGGEAPEAFVDPDGAAPAVEENSLYKAFGLHHVFG